ncbi:hypothetical protein PIB30_070480 [Stylosanthes scabra]|uniref:Uncharacterized protein n=1 Tax=Stylosanthes scabra TaxID=79078 RepID=A0ABU6YME0_9FABA|nr:hypothetical protein [Stylosanthes scabra]
MAYVPQLHSGAKNLLFFLNVSALPEEPKVALQPSPFTPPLPPSRFEEDYISMLLPIMFEAEQAKQGKRELSEPFKKTLSHIKRRSFASFKFAKSPPVLSHHSTLQVNGHISKLTSHVNVHRLTLTTELTEGPACHTASRDGAWQGVFLL